MRNIFFIPVMLFFIGGCHDHIADASGNPSSGDRAIVIPDSTVQATDTSLHLVNGIWFYQQQTFSGTIVSYFSANHLQARKTYYKGKEEGWQYTYYENGNKDSKRYYHGGEKDSINQGWWLNGNPRYEYHFKDGAYEGDFKEWYMSGKPIKHITYHKGKEQSGMGWRENGKVYMSFVMKDGRLYGLINPNLCYSLKNERGEFVKSK
jgi:hypothetical protein